MGGSVRRVGPVLVTACLALGGAAPARGEAAAVTPPGNFTLTAAAGQLGSDPIYNLRLAYYPQTWLGLEGTLAHNPSGSVHALLHYANAIARWPRPGRLRPFVTAGLGTIEVFPGTALNARPVTKLLLDAGAGTQLHLREDVALRFEVRSFSVLDQQEGHRGAYAYAEWSCGLTFTRSLHASEVSDTGAEP
jgi:hypothetical protein